MGGKNVIVYLKRISITVASITQLRAICGGFDQCIFDLVVSAVTGQGIMTPPAGKHGDLCQWLL